MAGGGNPDNCVVTAVSRFTEQVGSMGKRIIIIHQLPHNSIKLQRASRDALSASQFIGNYSSASNDMCCQ